jgi:tetratricopeptide (TPR) repeat protein
MKQKEKYVKLGKLVDEYLVKLSSGEKISINDWAELHKKDLSAGQAGVSKSELMEQLRMGVLLTRVGETARSQPTLSDQQRQSIKKNVLDYYDNESPKWKETQSANQYLSDAADAFGRQDYKTAKELLNQAIEIHQELKNDVWLGFEHSILGIIAIAEDNFDAAIGYFQKAEGFYRETDQRKARAGVLGHLGMVGLSLNKLDLAEESFKEALKLANEIALTEVTMSAVNNLGLIELARGRYLAAFELFQKTLAIAQEQNDKETQAIAYANMAEASENGRAHKTAIELYHKSLALSREGKYSQLAAGTAARLGALYASHNKWEEASQLFNEASSAVDRVRGASTEPAAVKFRRALGSLGMPSTEEVLTDFRRRIKEEQTLTAQI